MNDFPPKARKKNILATSVADEVVVYDTESNKASCLDGLTALVWKACDGRADLDALLDLVRKSGYQDATEQLILMAIDQLDQAGLLENAIESNEVDRKGLKRREILSLLGTKAISTLPVLSIINIQPAIAQASCLPKHTPCTLNSQCCSNWCHNFKCAP
jgi:hypothetical protein